MYIPCIPATFFGSLNPAIALPGRIARVIQNNTPYNRMGTKCILQKNERFRSMEGFPRSIATIFY